MGNTAAECRQRALAARAIPPQIESIPNHGHVAVGHANFDLTASLTEITSKTQAALIHESKGF